MQTRGPAVQIHGWDSDNSKWVPVKVNSEGKLDPYPMYCDSGATLPTSPKTWQYFVHTPTGRKVLLQYDGTNWQPIKAYDAVTIYVDATNGTDDINHGYGTGTSAVRTLSGVQAILPIALEGIIPLIINLSAGNYVAVDWENYSGATINLNGTMTTLASLVATGGANGSGATATQVNGTFTAGEYDNKLIQFTSGANNGEFRVISKTTATRLWLVGSALPAAPVNGDTYNVLDWATVIDGLTNDFWHVTRSSTFIKFTSTGVYSTEYTWNSESDYVGCYLKATNPTHGILVPDLGFSQLEQCIVEINTSGTSQAINIMFGGAHFCAIDTKFIVSGAGLKNGVLTGRGTTSHLLGCEFDSGFWSAVVAYEGSSVLFQVSGGVNNFIHGCLSSAVAAQQACAVIKITSSITWTDIDGTADPNVGDTYADAATFCWVGI